MDGWMETKPYIKSLMGEVNYQSLGVCCGHNSDNFGSVFVKLF